MHWQTPCVSLHTGSPSASPPLKLRCRGPMARDQISARCPQRHAVGHSCSWHAQSPDVESCSARTRPSTSSPASAQALRRLATRHHACFPSSPCPRPRRMAATTPPSQAAVSASPEGPRARNSKHASEEAHFPLQAVAEALEARRATTLDRDDPVQARFEGEEESLG